MTPRFHPTLVNGPFGDPALFVDFLHERRALLFDMGDLSALPARKILRISDVFISHTHIDHFIGFDHFVRICLGRDKTVRLYGPPGFVDRVEHRLGSYTWNLVENYPTDFTIIATEIHPDGEALSAEFHCLRRFPREAEKRFAIRDGIILDDRTLTVTTSFLDHRTPSLAFLLEEKQHVNIMKNRVEEMGLQVGHWLSELKHAVSRGGDPQSTIAIPANGPGGVRERLMAVREIADAVIRIVPGQKVAYVTDAVHNADNVERIVSLARGADCLFIEATFLHHEAERAAEKCHLTARQAGELARTAGADRVVPFHFSAKYKGQGDLLEQELREAFTAG